VRFDPKQPFETVKEEEVGLGDKALNAIGMVGKGIDAYGGDASTRAAIYAAQDGKNPIQAFTDQYGKSDGAPTGEMIAERAGVPDKRVKIGLPESAGIGAGDEDEGPEINLRKAAGAGIEFGASPMGLLPFAKPVLKGTSEVAEFIKNSLGRSYMGRKAGQGMDAVGRGAATLGETISGASKGDIKTYWNKEAPVNDLIKSSGKNSAEIADQTRTGFQKELKGYRTGKNAQITAAEEAASGEKQVPVQSLLDQLDKHRGRLHKELDAAEIAQIDELSQKIENTADAAGMMSPKELIKVTKSLQNKGKRAFGVSPSGGQLGSQAQAAAKGASEEARLLRNKFIPDTEKPFSDLSRVKEITGKANKNLFLPGTPDGALFAAGAGKNERGLKTLQELSKATGIDFVEPAEIASSARTFSNPPLTPTDTTGKSLHRALLGAGIFGQGLGLLGAPIELTAKLGAAAASPAALKLGMDTAKGVSRIPGKAMGIAQKIKPENYVKAYIASRLARAQQENNKKKEKK
jgi:hypothetical protein